MAAPSAGHDNARTSGTCDGNAAKHLGYNGFKVIRGTTLRHKMAFFFKFVAPKFNLRDSAKRIMKRAPVRRAHEMTYRCDS
jgi:hypothetical protein